MLYFIIGFFVGIFSIIIPLYIYGRFQIQKDNKLKVKAIKELKKFFEEAGKLTAVITNDDLRKKHLEEQLKLKLETENKIMEADREIKNKMKAALNELDI